MLPATIIKSPLILDRVDYVIVEIVVPLHSPYLMVLGSIELFAELDKITMSIGVAIVGAGMTCSTTLAITEAESFVACG